MMRREEFFSDDNIIIIWYNYNYMNYYNYYTQSLVLYYFSHFVVEMKIRELVKSFLIFFSAQFLIIIVAAAKTSYCKWLKVH